MAQVLTRIESISGIDAFDAFSWNAPALTRYNLIYGWNGSGKTTISRLLRLLQQRSLPAAGFTDLSFCIHTTGGALRRHDLQSHGLALRVFNEDFVRDNIVFADGRAARIVILGKDSIAAHERIASLQAQLSAASEEAAMVATDLRAAVQAKDAVLTEAGALVPQAFADTPLARGQYNGRLYNRSNVQSRLREESVTEENAATLAILSPESEVGLRDLIKNERRSVTVNLNTLPDLAGLWARAQALLTTTVDVKVIPRLQDDPALRLWAEHGYQLHRERTATSCFFCEAPLSEAQLERLGNFFTEELLSLKAQCTQLVSQLEVLATPALSGLDSSLLFPDLLDRFLGARGEFEEAADVVNAAIHNLATRLRRKAANLHEPEQAQERLDYPAEAAARLAGSIRTLRSLLEQHNSRTGDYKREVSEAATQLELHIIAGAIVSRDYFAQLRSVQALEHRQVSVTNRTQALKAELGQARAEALSAAAGISLVNELLADFFGVGAISLELEDDESDAGGYLIKRRMKDGKFLSDGEKGVLALIYFLVKLQEEAGDLANCIVVLDDPVDSQDANYLFHTAGLLKRQLAGMAQVVILTHNFDFFNLVRDWFLGRQLKSTAELFMVQKASADGLDSVEVTQLSALLRDYKTEYHYLFARLLLAADGTDPVDALLVPNIARRVLEYFANFKWSCRRTDEFNSIVQSRFVASPDQRYRGVGDFVSKFLHEYSHGGGFSREVTAATFEVKEVVQQALGFIELADKEHYDALVKKCRANVIGTPP